MLRAYIERSILTRGTGGFSSLTRGMHSMRRIGQPCYGLSGTSGPGGGAQFTFNCYCHWATLVVRHTADGSGHFLHSKEGVTQGDPLAMIAYGIGVLPLIRDLRRDHPCITQPWYADDVGTGGKFGYVMAHFRDLQMRGPA